MNSKADKKMTKAEETKAYLDEAKSWETDKLKASQASEKKAWRVAAGAGVTAIASVFAVAAMMPLKEVEPFVVRVDNSTGIVDVVKALKDGKTNYDEVTNKYFTQWYVRYREGYSRDLAEEYYSYVGLMSGGLEQQKYAEWFNPKNPMSPLKVYGQFAKVKISVKSTSFIKPNVALVRYTKAIERGMDKPILTHWAATISFKYSGAPMKEIDREKNPLGFQVLEYRNDPDSLANEAAPQAPNSPEIMGTSVPQAPEVTVMPTVVTPTSPAVPAIQR